MSIDLFAGLSSLERALDFHLDRHGVLSSNLANAETPGFRPQDLIRGPAPDDPGGLVRTAAAHIDPGSAAPHLETVESEVGRDENGVRLEQAMVQLSANRMRYDAAIELARRRLALLRYAATNGAG